MAIGKRISQRLEELGWKRHQLLERLPNLTPQALSNLIIRDSKRSEWDEEIAGALGVSVMWLVYGKEDEKPIQRAAEPQANYGEKLSEKAVIIGQYFDRLDKMQQAAFQAQLTAAVIGLPDEKKSQLAEIINIFSS